MAGYGFNQGGGGHGNGLGLAMQLWGAFRNGGTLDQEKAQKTQQEQANAIQQVALAKTQQDWGDQQAVRNASEHATNSLLTPGGINLDANGAPTPVPVFPPGGAVSNLIPGMSHLIAPKTNETAPYTPDSLKFYSEMSPEERQTATSPFKGVPDIMRPDTYDAWVARQTNRLPPIKYPSNFGAILNSGRQTASPNGAPIPDYSGDLSKIAAFPRRSIFVPKLNAEGKLTPTEVPAPLGPDQIELLNRHPESVQSHFDEIQQPEAKAFVEYRDAKIKGYQEQVKTNPQIGQWVGAGGENKGMQAQLAKVRGIIEPHLLKDKAGNILTDPNDPNGRPLINPKKPLTGSEANALVYAMGAVDNPGMGVRDNEFERIFKAQGYPEKLKAYFVAGTGTGNEVSPQLTGDVWNLAQNTGSTAKELAYNNLMGIEQNAAKEGIPLDRIMPDVSVQKDYSFWKQIKTAPQFDSIEAATAAKVAPGTVVNVAGRILKYAPGAGRGESSPSPNPAEDARAERAKRKPGTPSPFKINKDGSISTLPQVASPGGTPSPRPLPVTLPGTPPPRTNPANVPGLYEMVHPPMQINPLYNWALRNLVAPRK